ncbi:type II toxin-antitoxin system HicB family antitoxin [Aquincola tertiaricarbonis]|uniref:type II toxin-antitoxin system HicB family antitoxin n=1 Tax=Aquincola tertiaricarbonis TaxID=391953 RepID=UPI0012ED1E85|nr:hypothetical protein [Aquincola tertiaricarbonis]
MPQFYGLPSSAGWETRVMPHLRFAFPVAIVPTQDQRFDVTCRDFPELRLRSSGSGLLRTLMEVEDALDAVIAHYLELGRALPRPSLREAGEHVVAPSPQVIASAIRLRGVEGDDGIRVQSAQ